MRWAVIALLAVGCATASQQKQPELMRGVASWYGEEYAGRTTANGEIFDPMQLTAAHRTLPFGTVVEVTNQKTRQSVRVRINDRGPYVGKRVIDLSYAAAREISLIEPGSGEVDIRVVRMGRGDREPPAPYVVTIEEPAEKERVTSDEPPAIAFPLPTEVAKRRRVSDDGRTIEEVPVRPSEPAAPPRVVRRPTGKFVVQAGAFAVESNAKELQARLTRIGQESYVERDDLYRVRIGPFTTREQAASARAALEANGMSAIILTE